MTHVLLTEHPTHQGKRIMEICLNAEKSLNALTLDMVRTIQTALDQYITDDSVVAIILMAVGRRRFVLAVMWSAYTVQYPGKAMQASPSNSLLMNTDWTIRFTLTQNQ